MEKNTRPPFDTRLLANNALQAATKVRAQVGLGQVDPLCIYDTCDKLGVSVRFVDINMDGMYNRAAKPKILISSLRPLVRRNMTCAHELGHHVFDHGSTIDELESTASAKSFHDPIEFLADRFASSLLLPTLGVRKSLNLRGNVTARSLWALASDYKVSFSAVLNHLRYSLSAISHTDYLRIKKEYTPQSLRTEALGFATNEPAVLVDSFCAAKTVDVETQSWIISTHELAISGTVLAEGIVVPAGYAYQVLKQGIERITDRHNGNTFFVRASKKAGADGYVGLAKYRHLSEVDDA